MRGNEKHASLNYFSRNVMQIVNEYGDEIELETFQYQEHYRAVATICQEKPPFKDYFTEGFDYHSEKTAAEKAIKQLYREAYSYPAFQFILMNRKLH